ncbi:MAG: hypothetical protein J7K26_01410 [Candidatus Aenigmarchaeota archaeon]|nr:hypothetical protein [Candidatus Aenigmarchaeota archaeon]
MKKKTANQIMALLVVFLFAGSGFAYAFSYLIPSNNKNIQLYFDRPLENSEEAPYLQKNYVIVRLYFSSNDSDINKTVSIINNIFQDLDGKIVVEFINIDYYPNSLIEKTPFIYLKGKSIDKIYDIEYSDLKSRICDLYFEPINECE